MEKVKNIEEFINKGYNDDIKKIIYSKFINILKDDDIEEVTNSFYLKMIENKAIEKFDPEFNVKFSTYIYTCLHNFMLGRTTVSSKKKLEMESVSLDKEINDNSSAHNFIADKNFDKDFSIDRQEIMRVLSKSKRGRIKFVDVYQLIYEGYTDPEIAAILQCTASYIGLVKRDIKNILNKLFN
jgi:DNA-directed RNA polymerase specialized sigma subunit